VEFRQKEANDVGGMLSEKDPVAARRAFWIFLTIFSVTIFAVSAHMASGYWHYCQTAERLSMPRARSTSSANVAAAFGPEMKAPAEERSTLSNGDISDR
jgi:hypothetical protein